MTVPSTVGALWRQRRRWATGLVQVLRRHARGIAHWKNRRHWPVFIEAALSILWAHVLIALVGFWALCAVTGAPARGASPFPNAWGMLIASVCLLQIGTGVWLDRRYDSRILKSVWVAPLYPVGYWLFSALVTLRSTVPALLAPRPIVSQWHTVREPTATSAARALVEAA
jgi:biofilm PGA synthesis N-glycosyltransferase PgaC